ncbi:hypothetical protein [Kribbella solani]|uniref:Uncharacterized protein n=1 Tax=Kribbella solani TaxID=236067 RepID=A0A841DV72_9ACTN|nr:hypothetical protein [Kribbella solani]MBB5979198.1 hypothetical protein [Kribbella solani]
MPRRPRFWRSRARDAAASATGAAPRTFPNGSRLAIAAGFLVDIEADGLYLYTSDFEVPADQLKALVVVPDDRRPRIAYRLISPGGPAADMDWSVRGYGDLGSDEQETVGARLEAAAKRGHSLDRQLADANFEKLAEGAWRFHGSDSTITVVRDGNGVAFYTPVHDRRMADVIRASQMLGVVQTSAGSEQGLRFSGEWMSYTLVAPVPYPRDAEMTRAITPAEIGMRPVPRSTQPDGFVIGGANETEVIRRLTELGGRPIQELEAWMRPFDPDRPLEPVDHHRSQAGFLGPKDGLLRTLARDNEVVRRLGLTHTEVGDTVRMATWAAGGFGVSRYVGPGDHRYSITARGSMGQQLSPFWDGTGGSSDYQITNDRTGSSVAVSDLGGPMISKYGFYQGPGSPYRTAPEDIIRTFSDLTEKAGGEAEVRRVVAEVDAYFSAAEAVDKSTLGNVPPGSATGTSASSRSDGRPPENGPKREPDARDR